MARAVAVVLALSGGGFLVAATALPAAAAVTATFTNVFSANLAGNIQIRGNTILSCPTVATACASGRATSNINNNQFFMTYVDVDADATTFDSSSATVDVPAGGSVLFAALTWGGNTTAGTSLTDAAYGTGVAKGSPTPANAGRVKLKVPGSSAYAAVTSSRTSYLSGTTGNYQGYADVTAAVRAAGNGSYTVADVQTATGVNIQGGWALTVAYSDPAAPQRNLTVFSGFGSVGAGGTVDLSVAGFESPPSGVVHTTLGLVSYEGDAGVPLGDQIRLGSTVATLKNVTDALHPAGNSLISVLSDAGVDSSTRDPKYLNQLGFDAATFAVDGFLANASTSAVIRLTSTAGGETYYPGVVTFATELYAPELTATKSVAVVAKGQGNVLPGVAEPGDTLEYTIDASNIGQDAAVRTVLTDVVPAGTTYLPGSITTGGVARTDAAGDDIARYTAATRTITVDTGTAATPTVGGTVSVGQSIGTVRFRVVVDTAIADGASIPNSASFTYAGALNGIALAAASNVATTAAVRHRSDLAITKTADQARVQRGAGTPVTYTLTVTDAGPYADPAVTVSDALPAGATLVSAVPSAGSCAPPTAGTVTCALGALANGAAASVVVTLTLDATADPATDTATVVGRNLDDARADNAASRATAVNTAPVAGPDTGTTAGGVVTIAVLANDSDADGDALTVTPAAPSAARGTVVVNQDRSITYTATPGEVGTDTFGYAIADGRGGSAVGTVTVTIPNAPPVATPDSVVTLPGATVTVPVLVNDTDANVPRSGQVLAVTAVTQPAGGAGVVTTDGSTVTFTPSGAFRKGSATFGYTVSDGAGGTASAAVTVTVPNIAPVAADDDTATTLATPVTIDVLAGGLDDNDDELALTAVTDGAHGTAVVVGSGTAARVRYTPAAKWGGADALTYTISDGTETATGRVAVVTANAPPTAGSFAVVVDGVVATTIDVLAHTADPNDDPLTLTGAGPATHGTVTVTAAGAVVYTPAATFVGTDAFDYTVSDGNGGTATGRVTVTVRDQAPTAADDVALVPVNGVVDIAVLVNDHDGNGDTLTVSLTSAPAHGTVVVLSGGTVRYTPARGYLGADAFGYSVDDGRGATAGATVTIDVANQPPVALPDAAGATGVAGSAVTIDVLANDTDPNGDLLTVASVSAPAHGTAAVVGNQIVYTPSATYAGPDVFGYVVTDGRGGSAGASVTIDVRNRAPATAADHLDAATAVAATVDVLANDVDPDGELLALASVDATSAHGGTLSIVGGLVRYVSPTRFTGTDSFEYVATDPRGGTASGTVTVTVTNAAPAAPDLALATTLDAPATIGLLAGAADPDGQPLSVTSAGPAAHGAVAMDPAVPGAWATYTPVPGYAGTDVFSYVVSDGQGAVTLALVHVTVANADPVVADDHASTPFGSSVSVDVLANDTDPNIPVTGQQLAVTAVRVVTGSATALVDASGRVRVIPARGFVGTVVLAYDVSDGAGGIATGRLVVDVAPALAAVVLAPPIAPVVVVTPVVTPAVGDVATITKALGGTAVVRHPAVGAHPVAADAVSATGDTLAATGSESGAGALLGLVLVLVGGLLVLGSRALRRRRS